jgi:hypothetical protein
MTSPLFSIDMQLTPETQAVLESISKSLETIAQKLTTPSNVVSDVPNVATDEPTELSVCIPDDLIERPAERIIAVRTTLSKGVIWNRVTGHQRLMWRNEGDVISLLYNESSVKTTWDEVKRLSRISKNRRRMEIQKVLSTRIADRITAVSVFVSSYLEGLVPPPAEPGDVKEDPDAAFKPMVTPHISTRPDENCGSIESLQGAY